jgi:exosortase
MLKTPDNLSQIPRSAAGGARNMTAPAFFSGLLSGWTLAIMALAACWFLFFVELRGEWATNAQYGYGYVVPLLGAALLLRRWQERPASLPGNTALAGVVACGFLCWLLPLRVVLEANPEWRLVYWAHGCVVVGLSFCLLYRAGGWKWVNFFAPPLVFMLIAVPWPMGMEQAIIQNLMRLVAGLTVEVVGWRGIPALQHGNLIEITGGVVGIDEACSGVRSLQSALMLSLFLGEMYRFAAGRRVLLLVASLGFVLLANVARTTFLTWAAATYGLPQMEAWHDTAGIVVMLIVVSGLFGLAYLIRPRAARVAPPSPPGHCVPGALSRSVAIGVIAWLLTTEVVTEIWYRTHETDLVPSPRWSVSWPNQSAGFKKVSLPENSLAILRCSESDSASWNDDEGNQWSAFLLRWNPGRNSAQLAKGHRPDICFPAAGARLVEDFGQVTANANGIDLPFRHESFESGSRFLHVFYCLWSDRVSRHEKPLLENGTEASRLQAVLAGKRNLGQQVLEVVVSGPATADEAVSLFRSELPNLVQRE